MPSTHLPLYHDRDFVLECSAALSGLGVFFEDPGAARNALAPGYPLPRLRRCLSRAFYGNRIQANGRALDPATFCRAFGAA